jgi:hypothetical protein
MWANSVQRRHFTVTRMRLASAGTAAAIRPYDDRLSGDGRAGPAAMAKAKSSDQRPFDDAARPGARAAARGVGAAGRPSRPGAKSVPAPGRSSWSTHLFAAQSAGSPPDCVAHTATDAYCPFSAEARFALLATGFFPMQSAPGENFGG